MTKVSVARALVDALVAEDVSHVFGLPGAHIIELYDALYDTPGIRHVLVRHEHVAASMAAGYAQLTGRPGVCLATAGPGATNLLSAVAEAYVGSLPLVVLAGRARTDTAHRGAAQEVPTDRVFAPVTKWAVRVDRADIATDLLRHAFVVAQQGKPGPVLVEIPWDVLETPVPVKAYVPAGPRVRTSGDPGRVEAAAAALAGAERPIIIAGGGTVASGASAQLRELAELGAIPVLTSLAGRGSISDDHPLSVGGLGLHRNRLSARLLAEADVVLGLGTRFEEMETNFQPGSVPSPQACYIQVDADGTEIGRSVPARIGIVGDIALVLEQLTAALRERHLVTPGTAWRELPRVRALGEEIRTLDEEADRPGDGDGLVSPLAVIRAARRALPRDGTVAIDIGRLAQQLAGAFPLFRVFEPRSLIVPSSFYGMGFAAAALPVARLVHPDRPALGFVGDGSFQMVLSVLPAAAQERLGVTWCVLDDAALGSIRDIQVRAKAGRVFATEFSVQPDLARIAEACSCYGERVERAGEVGPALERALAANEDGVPAVLDFQVASRDS